MGELDGSAAGQDAAAPARRLRILYVTHVPPSPPRSGAPARMHGLMQALSARHALDAVSLVWPGDDPRSEAALREYCGEVTMVPAPDAGGARRRLAQARSLLSRDSFERRLHALPALSRAVAAALAARRYDVVNVESPFLPLDAVRTAPPGAPAPRVVLGEHNVEWQVVRQMAQGEGSLARRAYNALDWRKLRREERAAWRAVDGVTVTSAQDAARLREDEPGVRTAVVPNAVDVARFVPRASGGPAGPPTVLFFGALGYFPNTDGILWFLDAVWPRLAAASPDARLEIVGPRPPAAVLARRGPRVAVTGLVEDVRPHLAAAAVVVVPLRMGGGTRLKIVEAMAMGKPIVSTAVGAEGLDVTAGVDLLLQDDPAAFADAVAGLLADRGLAARLGAAARTLAEARYSWRAAAERLEAFYLELVGAGVAHAAQRRVG